MSPCSDDIEAAMPRFTDGTTPNVDVYVTGSNSKMLSTDIVTNFRDRGSEIKVYPLSLSEFYGFAGLEKVDTLEQYLQYGGMPKGYLGYLSFPEKS